MSGTITEIRKTGDDPPRVTVFVDGVEAFTVSGSVADELGLSVGARLARPAAECVAVDEDRARAVIDPGGQCVEVESPSVVVET